jgi:hypothetical protein
MRIFVGGLPRTATKDDLVRLFRQFGAGEDDIVLPRDRRTRRRKGVAYVEIADPERARAAIEVFAGFAIDGKPLTVCAAEDRPVKRPRARRNAALLFAIVAAGLQAASAVRADPVSAAVGLTFNPVIGGVHESYDDRQHIPPIPIPLIEASAQDGPFEVDLNGLPPIASVRSYDALQGHTSTQLSIFEGIARVWDPLHRFSAGIGQTLYNQSTHYSDAVEIAGTGETQFSRVTGITYEGGYGVPFRHGRFEAVFNYAPVMLGTQYTIYDVGTHSRRADPERAEQIDTAVRYTHPIGPRGAMILGLRYVNYTARYAELRGGLSDRNVGLLAVIGYRARLGP